MCGRLGSRQDRENAHAIIFGFAGFNVGKKQKNGSGTLAQLVEQRTFNPLVTGSNPVRPTTNPFVEYQKPAVSSIAGFFLGMNSCLACDLLHEP
jgi:hypothetical protein